MSMLHQRLYDAYLKARKKKRTKPEQIRFEIKQEKYIYELCQEIEEFRYTPSPMRVFVTKKPVIREIFAPVFRDRVIHHLIYNYIYEYMDRKFIYDSYSCRVGRGTLFGIDRVKKFLLRASENYTQDAYILKLDISGYFMNINREILLQQIENMLDYEKLDITRTEQKYLRYLIREVVLNDASINAERRSPKSYWNKIPKNKSLFHTGEDCGLPIGSLTSQLFSNVYLNDLDHALKKQFRYYGRYVDDLILVHRDKQKLLDAIPFIKAKLREVGLDIHPRKIYLQHYTKGCYFLGQYINPRRVYINRRVKMHFYRFWMQAEQEIKSAPITPEQCLRIESQFNSYFGVFSKANTFNYVHKVVNDCSQELKSIFSFYFSPVKNQMKCITCFENIPVYNAEKCV